MPDFIYTLDSEPESDVELDAPADAVPLANNTAGPSSSSASASGANKTKLNKTTSGILKTKTKPMKSSGKKKHDEEDGDDEEEDGGPAPTIDPSFNFDLAGGGASFFDGLGGQDDGFGMGEDEVRSGTKPVCTGFFSHL